MGAGHIGPLHLQFSLATQRRQLSAGMRGGPRNGQHELALGGLGAGVDTQVGRLHPGLQRVEQQALDVQGAQGVARVGRRGGRSVPLALRGEAANVQRGRAARRGFFGHGGGMRPRCRR